MSTLVLTIVPTLRINLGPLTTTFTPAAQCNVPFAGIPIGGALATATNFFQGQYCNGAVGVNDAISCWPTTTSTSVSRSAPLLGYGFYSPGLYCPSGYTTACKAALMDDGSVKTLANPSNSFVFQFGITAGETNVGCCPTGYSCVSGGGYNTYQTCMRVVTSTTISGNVCFNSSATSQALFTIPATTTSVIGSRTAVLSAATATLYAPLVQLNFRSIDIPTSTSSSARVSTSTASMTITAAPVGPAPTTPAVISGLSTGAKIGIGVAVPLAALAAIAILVWWILRRKRSRRERISPGETEQVKMVPYHDGAPAEMAGSPHTGSSSLQKAPVEAPWAHEVHELDATPQAQEMEGLTTGARTPIRGLSPALEGRRAVD